MKGSIQYSRDGKRATYFIDGKRVSKRKFDKAFPDKPLEPGTEVMAAAPSIWQDFTSEALAVHPKQVEEANTRSKKHGLGIKYDKKGFAHIPDRAARKKLLKLEGVHDKSGGYGD